VRTQVDRDLTTVSRVDRRLRLNKNLGRHRWLQLVRSNLNVRLSEQRDSFSWTSSKCFSVKVMYKDLMVGSASHHKLDT
jgi:hypothetical protein